MKYLSETGLAHFWGKIKSHVTKSIDDVKIGGRNLILASNFKDTTTANSKWTIGSGTKSFGSDDNILSSYGTYMKCNFTASDRVYYNTNNVWVNGQTYAVSFLAKTDTEGTTIRPSRSIADYGPVLTLTNEWKRYSGLINCTTTNSAGTLSLSVNKASVIYISDIKLEKGNKATDWTPAPEDTVNHANTANSVSSLDPANISSGYTKNRFYLNTHPENNGAVIPFLYNDLAFLKERDGSYEVYKTTDTDYTPETLTNKTTTTLNIDNAFDGSPSYVWFNSILTATTEKVVIDITFPSQINEASVFYIDFGSTSWRAKDIYYYSYNHLTGVYELHGSKTNNAIGQYQNYASYRIYNEDKTVYSYGRKKMRIVLTNFNSKDFRISQIGLINYSSAGLRRTYMSRGIDDVLYRNLTPATNNKYYLGTTTNKWHTVYANNFAGNATSTTKLATARKINGVDFDGTADIDFAEATTSKSGLMSASDKSKLNGFKQATEYYDTTTTDLKIQKAVDNLNIVNITYKDTVATFEDLPETAETGDLYSISTGGDYIWNGTDWVEKNTLLTKSIKLTDNTDLNNVINEGEYYGNNTCLNKPNDSGAFYLKVINQVPNVIQELRDTVNGRQYYRIIAFDGINAYYGNWIETYLGIKGVYYDNLLGGEYRSTINLGKGLAFGVSDELTVNTSDLDEATQSAKGLMSASDKKVFDKMPIIKSGSKIISATNSNGAQLFTKAELQTLFGVTSGFSINRVSGCVVNGDTAAFNGNYLGLRIASSNSNIYVHLDQTVSGTVNMRCNYTLFYNRE